MPNTPAAALPVARLLVLAGAMFASVSSEFLPTGILPDLAHGLGVSESQVGILVTIFAFTVALTAIPLSRLTIRFSRKPLLIATLLVLVATNVVCAVAPDYAVLAGARVVGGLAHALFWAVAGPYAARLVAVTHLLRATAITNSGGMLAFMVGVPIGAAIGHAVGWRATFWVMAVTILAFALLVMAFLPAVDHRVPLRTGEIPLPARRDPTLPLVLFVCAVIVLAIGGQNVMTTFIAAWLIQVPAVDPGLVALVLFIGGIGGTLALVLAGWLGDRGPDRLLTLVVGLTAVVGVVIFLLGTTPFAAIALVFAWNLISGMISPLCHGIIMRDASLRLRDTASAMSTVSFNIAIGGGALVGSGIVSVAGVGPLPLALTAFCLLAFGVLAVGRMRRRTV